MQTAVNWSAHNKHSPCCSHSSKHNPHLARVTSHPLPCSNACLLALTYDTVSRYGDPNVLLTGSRRGCNRNPHQVIAAGPAEGQGENGVRRAWAHRQGRALPVGGGGAAGHRAAQTGYQSCSPQHLKDVVWVPALPCICQPCCMLAQLHCVYRSTCVDVVTITVLWSTQH